MQSLFHKPVFLLALIGLSVLAQAQVLIKHTGGSGPVDPVLANLKRSLQFIAMGDWGRNGADHQLQVARQMSVAANAVASQFTVSTGDNFYPSGVVSQWDPLWKYSFEDIYTDFRLQWDWYPVLGNHDYKSNPDAQVAYSAVSRRWKMPARYYSRLIPINGDTTQQLLMVFIDTNPLIPEFYENHEYGPNVKGQDTAMQKRWIEEILGDPSPYIKWKIVVGHHPMFTGGSRTETYDTKAIRATLLPVLEKYKVDLYLSGHEHSLQHLQSGNGLHHVISGAASEKTPARLVDQSLMAASEYGFFVFSVTAQQMLLQAVNDAGRVIYRYEIKK
jgi:hypothetical protein